jgi:RNA polymerase sigma-70 factor (ECF subfamily)
VNDQDREPDPDLPILARYRAGDGSAFEEIIRRHRAPLERMVERYVKSREDAKDVVQQTFVRAIEKMDTFRGEASFKSWLFRIALNLALNQVRGAPAQTAFPLEDVAAFTHGLETSRLVAVEMWRKLVVRLEELPPKQRLVLELRIFHELSFREVADVADMTEESAKMNFHHAVKKLRSLLPRR